MRLDLTSPIIVMDACALPPYPSQRMTMTKMVLILFIFRWSTAEATFDMNLGQMQYVADHLTSKQCRQLVEALASDRMVLDKVPTGSNVPNVSCIRLLLQWDRTDGRGQSFTELPIRLKQIGRKDLADYLSASVYGEKISAVKESILNNPIGLGILPDSPLLSAKDKPARVVEPSHENLEHGLATFYLVAIILGGVAISLLVAFLLLRRLNWNCKAPQCWLFLKENVPIYLFGVTPDLPRELRERRQLLLAEERAMGNPYIV